MTISEGRAITVYCPSGSMKADRLGSKLDDVAGRDFVPTLLTATL